MVITLANLPPLHYQANYKPTVPGRLLNITISTSLLLCYLFPLQFLRTNSTLDSWMKFSLITLATWKFSSFKYVALVCTY